MVKKKDKKEKSGKKPKESPKEEIGGSKEITKGEPEKKKESKEVPKEKIKKPGKDSIDKAQKIKESVKEPKEKPKEEVPKREVEEEVRKGDFKHRVRLGGTVLDGNKDLVRSLTQIKGIGRQVSSSMVRDLKFDMKRKLGSLSDADIGKIEEKLQNLSQSLPAWMRNRRKDYVTGKDMHLVGTDLEITQRDDVKREKIIKSYRGIRHAAGLPVRGQRTRTSFRKGTTIGVVRKKALKQAKAKEKKE